MFSLTFMVDFDMYQCVVLLRQEVLSSVFLVLINLLGVFLSFIFEAEDDLWKTVCLRDRSLPSIVWERE